MLCAWAWAGVCFAGGVANSAHIIWPIRHAEMLARSRLRAYNFERRDKKKMYIVGYCGTKRMGKGWTELHTEAGGGDGGNNKFGTLRRTCKIWARERYNLACEFIEILEIRIRKRYIYINICRVFFSDFFLFRRIFIFSSHTHICTRIYTEPGYCSDASIVNIVVVIFFGGGTGDGWWWWRFFFLFTAQKLCSSFHFSPFEWMRNNFITYTNSVAWDQPNLRPTVHCVHALYFNFRSSNAWTVHDSGEKQKE